MPIVIYDFDNTPEQLIDRGQWNSSVDGKCVGWIDAIPENINTLMPISKQEFLDRIKYVHSQQSFLTGTGEDFYEVREPYTEEQILQIANLWYDDYVLRFENDKRIST